MSQLEHESERYAHHHRTARSRDFVFGGEERAELFRRHVGGPGRRVLDIGCRYGALTKAYLEGNQVVGLDVDRDALEEAAKLGIEPVWADADEPLPFEDESFDVAVCGEVLEHLRDPKRLTRELIRVLRPGGTLVGSVPNSFRLKNRLRFLAGQAPEDDPTLLQLFSPDDICSTLSGLDDVRLEFIGSRFLRLHPRLTGNVIVFVGRKPG